MAILSEHRSTDVTQSRDFEFILREFSLHKCHLLINEVRNFREIILEQGLILQHSKKFHIKQVSYLSGVGLLSLTLRSGGLGVGPSISSPSPTGSPPAAGDWDGNGDSLSISESTVK